MTILVPILLVIIHLKMTIICQAPDKLPEAEAHLWPWNWCYDLDVWTWPSYSEDVICVPKFGFQKLAHKQTDRHRQMWLISLAQPHCQVLL